MAQHTPAPWRADFGIGGRLPSEVATIKDANDQILASVALLWSRDEATDEAEATANARLMAAAPDLLAALEDLIAEIGGEWPSSWDGAVYEAAVDAIAKAEGE